MLGKETPAERRVWADPPSSSQPVRADWLSGVLVDQLCRREVSNYLL